MTNVEKRAMLRSSIWRERERERERERDKTRLQINFGIYKFRF